MWVERRSPAFRPWIQVNSKGEEPVPKEKSFDIPKQLVWDAYQRVKANRVTFIRFGIEWRRGHTFRHPCGS